MGLPRKILEQIAFNTRPEIKEHMLIVRDKSIHEEHISQPLQKTNKQFKVAITLLTGYNGIFDITKSESKCYFAKSITDEDDFIQIVVPQSAFEFQSLNNEIEWMIIRDVHFAVNSKILLSAVTQFEFAVNSAVNRNYQRYEKR